MENGLYKDKYGAWAGNTKGAKPDYALCCEEVARYVGNWPHYGQCAKKRGHGPDEAYCKTHDPVAVKARRDKSQQAENAKWEARKLEIYGKRFYAALVLIADGHNDARAVAREALSVFNKDK